MNKCNERVIIFFQHFKIIHANNHVFAVIFSDKDFFLLLRRPHNWPL